MQKYLIGLLLAGVGFATVTFWPSKTDAPLTAKQGAETSCDLSTTRPCYDRVTPGKTIGLAAKAGENSFKACVNSKSLSLRGFGHTKTTLSDLESYQYCFEGKSMIQVRWFSGSLVQPPITPPPSPKPTLACIKSPEFSILSTLDSSLGWSISNPYPIIDNYYASYIVTTIFTLRSGALFAAGIKFTDSGYALAMYKSGDGGVSWKSVVMPIDKPTDWNMVYAMTEDKNGVIYAGGTKLWKSVDGGNTWNTLPLPEPLNAFSGGPLPDAHTFLVTKDNSLIISFGTTRLNFGTPYYFRPTVYKSTDGGNTWNELFSNDNAVISIVEAADGSLVFRDLQYTNPSGVYRYSSGVVTRTFSDGAVAMEYTAELLKSSDGAIYFISPDTSADINTIDYTQPGNAYLAAYKSTDNGITWTKLGTLPHSWSVQGPLIESPDGTLHVASWSVCNMKDTIYRSTNKGATWSALATSPKFRSGKTDDLYYYYRIDGIVEVLGKVLIGGNAPVIFTTK